jgi:hypothetical protein
MQGVVCILVLAYITHFALQLVKGDTSNGRNETIRTLVILAGIVLAFVIVWVYAGHGVALR